MITNTTLSTRSSGTIEHRAPTAGRRRMRARRAGDGFDTLVFWPVDPSARQVELFADEIVPLLPDD